MSRAIVHAQPETFEVHHISCLDEIETDSYNLSKTSVKFGAVCLRYHHEFLCQVRSFQLRLKCPYPVLILEVEEISRKQKNRKSTKSFSLHCI